MSNFQDTLCHTFGISIARHWGQSPGTPRFADSFAIESRSMCRYEVSHMLEQAAVAHISVSGNNDCGFGKSRLKRVDEGRPMRDIRILRDTGCGEFKTYSPESRCPFGKFQIGPGKRRWPFAEVQNSKCKIPTCVVRIVQSNIESNGLSSK